MNTTANVDNKSMRHLPREMSYRPQIFAHSNIHTQKLAGWSWMAGIDIFGWIQFRCWVARSLLCRSYNPEHENWKRKKNPHRQKLTLICRSFCAHTQPIPNEFIYISCSVLNKMRRRRRRTSTTAPGGGYEHKSDARRFVCGWVGVCVFLVGWMINEVKLPRK